MPDYAPGLLYNPSQPIIAGYLYHTKKKGDLVGFRVDNIFRGKGKDKVLVGRFVAYHCVAQGVCVLVSKAVEDGEDADLNVKSRVTVTQFLKWLNEP